MIGLVPECDECKQPQRVVGIEAVYEDDRVVVNIDTYCMKCSEESKYAWTLENIVVYATNVSKEIDIAKRLQAGGMIN